MTKYDFTASTNQLVKTGNVSGGDATKRIQSFMRPSISMAGTKIAFFESGNYMCALPFSEIGTIAAATPTDLADAAAKLIALIATLTV